LPSEVQSFGLPGGSDANLSDRSGRSLKALGSTILGLVAVLCFGAVGRGRLQGEGLSEQGAAASSPAQGLPNASADAELTSIRSLAPAIANRQHLEQLPQEELPTTQNLEWRFISQTPRIFVMDDFLSPEECDFLRNLVTGRLEPAKVVQKADNKWDMQTQVRNNKQIWLTADEERSIPLLRHIIKRLHRAARIPDDDAEALQIGHYDVGEKYELHLDTDPSNDVPRPATLIIYLNEAESGGETLFPTNVEARASCTGWHEGADGSSVYGIAHCCSTEDPNWLKIPTKTGRAVLFWNHDLAGIKDRRAEHGACPVKQGEKWIAQRWFRFDPYQNIVHPPDPRFDGLPSMGPPGSGSVPTALLPGRLEARVISQKVPRIYLLEDLLNPQECKHLVSLAPSLDAYEENGMERRWVPPKVESEDPVVMAVVKRMHRVALVPEAHGELLQLGHLRAGAAVQLHLDTAPDHALVRPFSLLVYLDGDGGSGTAGGTVFPMGRCQDLQECCNLAAHTNREGGPIVIPPKAGRAVLFASHRLDGKLDGAAVHGSCPAGPHGKWVAQRWFRAGTINGINHAADLQFDGPGVLRV